MAKIRPNFRSKRGANANLSAEVYVERTTERGSAAFYSCARVGKSRRAVKSATGERVGNSLARKECAYGKNPRQAIGNALKALGAKLSRQKGAFAGYK